MSRSRLSQVSTVKRGRRELPRPCSRAAETARSALRGARQSGVALLRQPERGRRRSSARPVHRDPLEACSRSHERLVDAPPAASAASTRCRCPLPVAAARYPDVRSREASGLQSSSRKLSKTPSSASWFDGSGRVALLLILLRCAPAAACAAPPVSFWLSKRLDLLARWTSPVRSASDRRCGGGRPSRGALPCP